jgi:hypothetical protein
MTLSEWLDQEIGRPTRTAEHFGVSRSAVSQWRKIGVPRKFMLGVRDYSRGAVTLEEMVAHQRPVNENGRAAA